MIRPQIAVCGETARMLARINCILNSIWLGIMNWMWAGFGGVRAVEGWGWKKDNFYISLWNILIYIWRKCFVNSYDLWFSLTFRVNITDHDAMCNAFCRESSVMCSNLLFIIINFRLRVCLENMFSVGLEPEFIYSSFIFYKQTFIAAQYKNICLLADLRLISNTNLT